MTEQVAANEWRQAVFFESKRGCCKEFCSDGGRIFLKMFECDIVDSVFAFSGRF